MRLFIAICVCRVLYFIGRLIGKGTAKPGDIARVFCPKVLNRLKFDGKIICITGTNGKTSVAYLLDHCLRSCGLRSAMIGTVQVSDGAGVDASSLTTPDPSVLHGILARAEKNLCTHAVMEVSSHAMALGRVAGLQYACSVFTNLSQDHLNFHGTMDNYAAAKAELSAHKRKHSECKNYGKRYKEVKTRIESQPIFN